MVCGCNVPCSAILANSPCDSETLMVSPRRVGAGRWAGVFSHWLLYQENWSEIWSEICEWDKRQCNPGPGVSGEITPDEMWAHRRQVLEFFGFCCVVALVTVDPQLSYCNWRGKIIHASSPLLVPCPCTCPDFIETPFITSHSWAVSQSTPVPSAALPGDEHASMWCGFSPTATPHQLLISSLIFILIRTHSNPPTSPLNHLPAHLPTQGVQGYKLLQLLDLLTTLPHLGNGQPSPPSWVKFPGLSLSRVLKPCAPCGPRISQVPHHDLWPSGGGHGPKKLLLNCTISFPLHLGVMMQRYVHGCSAMKGLAQQHLGVVLPAEALICAVLWDAGDSGVTWNLDCWG